MTAKKYDVKLRLYVNSNQFSGCEKYGHIMVTMFVYEEDSDYLPYPYLEFKCQFDDESNGAYAFKLKTGECVDADGAGWFVGFVRKLQNRREAFLAKNALDMDRNFTDWVISHLTVLPSSYRVLEILDKSKDEVVKLDMAGLKQKIGQLEEKWLQDCSFNE